MSIQHYSKGFLLTKKIFVTVLGIIITDHSLLLPPRPQGQLGLDIKNNVFYEIVLSPFK